MVAGQANRMSLVASLHRGFSRLTNESMSQLRKVLRKFFKKLDFGSSRDLVWQLVRKWKLKSQGYTEAFVAPFETSSQVDLPITKNT